MSNKTTYLNNIRTRLGGFAYTMKMNGKVNRLGEHISAEDICCGLLNLVFDYELQNANQGKANQIAVDLTDEENRIAVQITTTNTKQKVQNTIDGFLKANLSDRFDTLMVLVMTGDDKFRGWDKVTCPDAELRILNFVDLSTELEHKPLKKLKAISDYMDEHFGEPQAASRPAHLLPPVPAPTLSFVPGSRDGELAILEERLRTENAVFLWGLGGIGKTQAAIQLAKKLAPEKGAYFLRYQLPMDPGKEAMRHSILQLDIKGYRFQGADNDSRDAEYAERMALLEREYAGALIIVDNFDRDGVRPEEMLREEACRALLAMNMKLVFTTRNDFGSRGVEIKPLSETDLLALMRGSFTDQRVSDETLLELIRAVQGHTLMVDLMAKTLREGMGDLTPEALIQALRSSDLNRADFETVYNDRDSADPPERIYVHLRKLFDLSGMNAARKRVLTYATLLPEDGMDAGLFKGVLEKDEKDALRLLTACGWLQRDDGNLLTIHPVVRQVCREELKPTDDNCWDFLVELWNQNDFSREYDAVKYAQLAGCFSMASDRLEDREADWACFAGRLWGMVGQLRMALDYELRMVTQREKNLPPDSKDLATAYNNVGITYGNLGDHGKALEYQLKALAIREKVLPADHPDLAQSHNNVGETYRMLGDSTKALEYHLNTLTIWEKVLPADHPDLATSCNNVGCTYDALGDHGKALEYQMKAIDICEKVLPADHPDLAVYYSNVGCVYGTLGDHDKALEYQLKALVILEKVLPADHPDLATSYNNVGITYYNLGEYDRALELCEKALAIREKKLPAGHPDLALSYNNVGTSYYDLGEYEHALALYEKALAIREQKLPAGHPYIQQSRQSIASVKRRLAEKEPVSP